MFKPPDWKDAANYPTPGKASNAQFAWEFLRRNPAYGEAWGAYVAKLKEAAGANDELLRYVACIAAPDDLAKALCEPFSSGPKRANDAYAALDVHPCLTVTEDFGDGRKTHTPLTRQMGMVWGLETMANPAHGYRATHVSFRGRKGSIRPTSYGLARLEEEHKDHETSGLSKSKWLVLQIDLEQPLQVIEKTTMWAIKSALNNRTAQGWIKPIKARARPPALMVHYLRILDAKLQKVTVARIGEVLNPGDANDSPQYGRDKAIKAAARAAEGLRDNGYRLLPLLEDKLPPWPTS